MPYAHVHHKQAESLKDVDISVRCTPYFWEGDLSPVPTDRRHCWRINSDINHAHYAGDACSLSLHCMLVLYSSFSFFLSSFFVCLFVCVCVPMLVWRPAFDGSRTQSAVADSRISRRIFIQRKSAEKKPRLAEIAAKNVQPNISRKKILPVTKLLLNNYRYWCYDMTSDILIIRLIKQCSADVV